MATPNRFIHGVTLTGADERTDLDALAELALQHPDLEVGLLYSETPEGRPRYPSLSWIERAVDRLPDRCALHVCGSGARAALMVGELSSLVPKLHRVQVNGRIHPDEIHALARRAPILITQWQLGRDSHDFEDAVARAQESDGFRHQWLVDGSGGRGVAPDVWSKPMTRRSVGFAGGLGPGSLAAALPKINAASDGITWIDMESSLRTNDWFDLSLCRAALEAATPWLLSAGDPPEFLVPFATAIPVRRASTQPLVVPKADAAH